MTNQSIQRVSDTCLNQAKQRSTRIGEFLIKIQMPKLVLANGSIEALKWLALVLMTIDHVNKFLFQGQMSYMFEVGRLAMPLFGFVLAYNLARPEAMLNGMHLRAMQRLFIFGLLASPFFIPMAGWWPINIMFMLLIATFTIYLLEKGSQANIWLCIIVFIAGGIFVEFFWFALAYCLAAWWYCKSPSIVSGLVWLIVTALLSAVNLNAWALAALPVIFLFSYIKIEMPRLRYIFYAYYPAHLALLLALSSFTSFKH